MSAMNQMNAPENIGIVFPSARDFPLAGLMK